MKTENAARIRRASALFLALAVLCFGRPAAAEPAAPAPAPTGAKAILKAASDWLGSQKSLELSFDSDIEIITPELEKIQFTNSGTMVLVRPDKFRAHRFGGYADVELVFDGKTASVLGKSINAYAQIDLPGDLDSDDRGHESRARRRDAGGGLPRVALLRRPRRGRPRGQAHGSGRHRRRRMRAPRVPQRRDRLAGLGREGRASDAPQDRDHEQDAGGRAAVHGPHQELEDRRRAGSGDVHVRAACRGEEARARRSRRPRRAAAGGAAGGIQ